MGDRRRSFEFRLLAQADKVRLLLALLCAAWAYSVSPGTVTDIKLARAAAAAAVVYALLSHFVVDWRRVRREGDVHVMAALLACFDLAVINVFVLAMGPSYNMLLTIMLSDIVFVAAFFSGLELALITFIACGCFVIQRPVTPDASGTLSALCGMGATIMVAWLAYAVAAVARDERVISDRVLRHLTEGVLLVSRHGKLAVINPRLEQMTGIEAKVLLGLDVHASENQAALAPIRQILAGVASEGDGALKISTRSLRLEDPFPLEIQCITVPCVSDRGPVLAWVVVCKDVTDVMSEVRQKEEDLEIVSHELRGRVHGLRASVEVLAGMAGALTQGMTNAALSLLDTETARITDLIGRVVDASAVRSGAAPMELAPVDVPALARQVRDCLAPVAAAKGVMLEVVGDPACPTVLADTTRLDQVMHNLVENAIKFTPAAGHVRTEVRAAGDGVQVSVTDTGCGIPQHELSKVFEKFVHGAQAREGAMGAGLGLGLYLCREIVTRHGGTLDVRSVEGQGSTFTFSIPRVPPEASAHAAAEATAAQRAALAMEGAQP